MTSHHVVADVATVWTGPEAPRPVDAPAVADLPDLGRWTTTMDPPTRAGLHGRVVTQLLRDEPVEVVQVRGDWVEVVAPWQPHPDEPRGYPGWVRRGHLAEGRPDRSLPLATVLAKPVEIARYATEFLGLAYLWGGTSPWGMDCSGLVHYCYRQAGIVVPRDADAQHGGATTVPLGEERPGDLYFFARDDGHVFHVGFVTARLHMLHASEEGGRVEDVALPAERLTTLAAAGRLGGP